MEKPTTGKGKNSLMYFMNNIASVTTNQTQFVFVSTYLHLFQETRCPRQMATNLKLQRDKRVRMFLHFTTEIASGIFLSCNHLLSVLLEVS